MAKKFSIVANEYENTGGHCMVNITTVYNHTYKTLWYVCINEECIVVTSNDYIRHELPGDLVPEDFIIHEISHECFTTEPSFDNHDMDQFDDDTTLLILDCLEAYIKNYVKDSGHHYFTTVDKLPNVLHKQVTDDYKHWLEEREQLVETDGYKIIVDDRYYKELENDTPNAIAAKGLQQLLDTCMPTVDVDTDHVLWDKFYNEKLQIIYCGKLFTFDNGADIYNGLEEFAEWVIDQQ